VLVALAEPPGVELLALTQLAGTGRNDEPIEDAAPPHTGGAVLAACTVKV
jgi:hypothetical protein